MICTRTSAAGGDYVDAGLAIGVGLDLETADILAVPGRVEDNGGVHDGFAVSLFQDL